MRAAIIDKLTKHMATLPEREADVVYALVQIRKLLEDTDQRLTLEKLDDRRSQLPGGRCDHDQEIVSARLATSGAEFRFREAEAPPRLEEICAISYYGARPELLLVPVVIS